MIFDDKSWLKGDAITNGEIITILNEGEWFTSPKFTKSNGEPKKDFIVKVTYQSKPYDLTINKTRKEALIKAFGKDSKDWVNKTCKVEAVNIMVGNKMQKTIVLYPIGGKDVQYEN